MTLTLNVLVNISGLPKSGKSHLGDTFPDPLKVYCFNGGASLVARKFPKRQITVQDFLLPIVESTADVWALPVWDEFYQTYKADVLSKQYRTVVLDTATEVENVCQQAVLEELMQEASLKDQKRPKQKLATNEFLARNLRMKALYDLARNNGVNLAALHYLKEKWIKREGEDRANNTGELVIDGWQRAEGQADINLEMQAKTVGARTVMVATVKSNRFDRDFNVKSYTDTAYDELYALLVAPWVEG